MTAGQPGPEKDFIDQRPVYEGSSDILIGAEVTGLAPIFSLPDS